MTNYKDRLRAVRINNKHIDIIVQSPSVPGTAEETLEDLNKSFHELDSSVDELNRHIKETRTLPDGRVAKCRKSE